ncbi:MAG: CRISPR-associated protein [Actinobacteria bacterium]|nr:CRISPR-associated protein [Actinomycetota bacterium]
MSYDFYTNFKIDNKEDVDNLISTSGKFANIEDVLSRVMLLMTALKDDDLKDYARVGERNSPCGLKALIHSNGNYNDYLKYKLSEISLIGINLPIDILNLPEGSWFIEIPLTLKKPFISKDDVPLYIIENPVRKDKVFGVPFTSAMAWKGNLRWTMMKIHLESKTSDPDGFAETRYKHTLLFGIEKEIEAEAKGWIKYLDELCPDARERYRAKLKKEFGKEETPSLTGMLYFYPTFWNRIDIEVINPHDRKTKIGKNPIYYEVVPAGAKGFFRILYLPFYYLGKTLSEIKIKIIKDLKEVVSGLKAMMLTYGFSAKKSSGYGVIEDNWDKEVSRLVINRLSNTVRFSNFKELEEEIKKILEAEL